MSSTYLPISLDSALPKIRSRDSSAAFCRKAQSDEISAVSLQLSEVTKDISDITPNSGGSGLFTYAQAAGLFDYTNTSEGGETKVRSLYDDGEDDFTAAQQQGSHNDEECLQDQKRVKNLYDDDSEGGEDDARPSPYQKQLANLYESDNDEGSRDEQEEERMKSSESPVVDPPKKRDLGSFVKLIEEEYSDSENSELGGVVRARDERAQFHDQKKELLSSFLVFDDDDSHDEVSFSDPGRIALQDSEVFQLSTGSSDFFQISSSSFSDLAGFNGDFKPLLQSNNNHHDSIHNEEDSEPESIESSSQTNTVTGDEGLAMDDPNPNPTLLPKTEMRKVQDSSGVVAPEIKTLTEPIFVEPMENVQRTLERGVEPKAWVPPEQDSLLNQSKHSSRPSTPTKEDIPRRKSTEITSFKASEQGNQTSAMKEAASSLQKEVRSPTSSLEKSEIRGTSDDSKQFSYSRAQAIQPKSRNTPKACKIVSEASSDVPSAPSFLSDEIEQKRKARAERLSKVRERIRRKEEEAKGAKKEEDTPDAKKDSRLRLAFQWWNRLGRPSREAFRRRVKKMLKNDGFCEVSTDDIESLPWTIDGTRVEITFSMAL